LFNTIISRFWIRAQRHLLKFTDVSECLVGPITCIQEKCLVQVVWINKYIEAWEKSSCSEACNWWAHIFEHSKLPSHTTHS